MLYKALQITTSDISVIATLFQQTHFYHSQKHIIFAMFTLYLMYG